MSAKKRAKKKGAKKSSKTKAAAKPKRVAKPKRAAKTKTKAVAKATAKKGTKKGAKKKTTSKKGAASALRRRDAPGHVDPKYASELRALAGRSDEGTDTSAFIGRPRSRDDLAEELGEEFVSAVTSGEEQGEDVANQSVPEELGGPFVVTTAGTEFAEGTDPSNPRGAKREPFPRT